MIWNTEKSLLFLHIRNLFYISFQSPTFSTHLLIFAKLSNGGFHSLTQCYPLLTKGYRSNKNTF